MILKNKTNNWQRSIVALTLLLSTSLPSLAEAATATPKVAGWIPYWSAEAGVKSATKNLNKLDTVYPFAFEVDARGFVVAKTDFKDSYWKTFLAKARKEKVEVIPTIAWFDGEQIHEMLSDDKKRAAHIMAQAPKQLFRG